MLYLLALRTGLRRKELCSLTPKSFDFSSSVPSVALHASESKRRKQDRLPLPKDLAMLFKAYVMEMKPDKPIWPGSWWRKSAEMIKKDMKDAGLSIADDQGRTFDFHGQRTTFITELSRAGILPVIAQKLARHSNINLTMGTYTSMELGELSSAVELLPGLVPVVSDESISPSEESAKRELAKVQDVWLELTEETRSTIMQLIENDVEEET